MNHDNAVSHLNEIIEVYKKAVDLGPNRTKLNCPIEKNRDRIQTLFEALFNYAHAGNRLPVLLPSMMPGAWLKVHASWDRDGTWSFDPKPRNYMASPRRNVAIMSTVAHHTDGGYSIVMYNGAGDSLGVHPFPME